MQTIEIVLAIAGVMFGSSVIASGITAFFARKKISAEAKLAVAEADSYSVGTMQKVLERYEKELEETRAELAAARVEIQELRSQIAQLLEQNRPADN